MRIGSGLFAFMYDRMSAKTEDAGLREVRRRLLADAKGRVLEIGGGTGANLQLYGPEVESLTVTEPEQPMLRRLDRKAREQAPLTRVLRARAEELPFADDSFDTVVSTLVLCGVDDQEQSLREVRRVLRPGGQFMFIEHVRSQEPKVARMQDRMNGVNRFVVRCDCNRATLETIEAEGFEVTKLERTELPKSPPFARPLIVGVATGT
ncbi:MAG TPA: class I SAM-dependent methyltransferase [Gaiellaceae bacterium]|jgi:ubiquinone/menaquinone biosynthesis C-methylase UbiE